MVAQSDRTVTFRLRIESDPSAPAALRSFGESITSEGKRAVNDFAAVASRQIAELQRRIQSMARVPGANGGFSSGSGSLPTARLVSVPLGPQPHPASPWPAQRPEATHIPTTVQRASSPLFNQPAPAHPGDLPPGERVHRPLPFREVENLSIVREAQKQRTEQDAIRSRGGKGPNASPIGGVSQQERDLARQNARDAADAEKVRREALGQTGRAYEDHIRKLERIRELEAKGKVSPGTAAMARREEIDRFTAPARRDAERQSARDEATRQREEQQRIRGAKQAEDKRKQDEARAQREQNKRTIDILRQQDKEEGERQKAIERDGKARERAVRENESARKKVVESNLKIGESFKAGLEGITSMARGFAYLGVTGEENAEKLLRGLARIEGAVALVRGSITVVSSVARGWIAVSEAIQAATVAQRAFAATQALTAVSGKAAAATAVGTAAAGSIGGSAVKTAAGLGTAAAAGTLFGRVGSLATLAGGSALSRLGPAGIVLAGGLIGGNVAAGRYDVTTGKTPEGFMARGIMGLSTWGYEQFGMGGTADEGAWKKLYESRQRTKKMEDDRANWLKIREDATKSWDSSHRLQVEKDQAIADQSQLAIREGFRQRGFRADQPLQYAQNRGEQLSARFARQEQERRIEEMDVRRPMFAGVRDRFEEERQSAIAELGRRREVEGNAARMTAYSTDQMRLARAAARLEFGHASANAQQRREEYSTLSRDYQTKLNSGALATPFAAAKMQHDVLGARERAEAASAREVAAAQARLQLEREISGQKIAAAQQSVEIGRREIESRTQAIENYRRQLTAGAESFGSLNRGDMSQAVNAMQAAREGRRLSDQQLGILDRIQTEDAQRAASEQRQRRAFEHFGGGEEGRRRYEEVFGRTERQGIERNERAVQRLQVDVGQQELKVNIDRTKDSSLVQSITRSVFDAVRQHDLEIVREVQKDLGTMLSSAMHEATEATRRNSWLTNQ